MTDIDEYLKEVRERCEKATPGPWNACLHLRNKEIDQTCGCGFPGDIWGADKEHVVCTMGPNLGDEEGLTPPRYNRNTEINNGLFIAHASTDIPRLLEIIEELKKHKETLDEFRRLRFKGIIVEEDYVKND